MRKLIFIVLLVLLFSNLVIAQETQDKVCFVYFTGVGCPHCAKTDPVVLIDLLKHKDIVIIEYEIYQQQENGPLLLQYNSVYNSGLGIPLIIFGKGSYIIGDRPILENINEVVELNKNPCPLANGSSVVFDELDLTSLPGKPKIWANGRILIKTNGQGNNELLKKLLISQNISATVEGVNYKIIEPHPVALSGRYLYFENAIELDGWIFQWNGQPLKISKCPICPQPSEWSECINNTKTRINYKCSAETDYKCVPYTEIVKCQDNTTTNISENQTNQSISKKTELTLVKLVSLAVVDAINPCALAVLTLMLIAILTYNPKKKRNVLLAGFAFTTSVFVMYLFYGIIIIKFFQIVQALTSTRLWLYKILGLGAIILGILNIKDFIKYKPGGFGTEMPLSLRPKVKKIISKVTSPKGAFGVGIFVTLFLLPCTIGPYVIVGGILSIYELINILPLLLLYNIIFVVPMIAITLIVYAGFAKVENVSEWKEKNIKKLHLIAGIIMLALGIAMVFGFI